MRLEFLFLDRIGREEIEADLPSKDSVSKSIYDIENADCWILTLETQKTSSHDADLLSDLCDYIVDKYNPVEITNDCSAYYNQVLFPLFNDFERQLRKLLYLKSALNQTEESEVIIRNLEEQDLGSIFEMLFTDTDFITSAKQQVNEKSWKYTKEEILQILNEIPENTLWDRLIGADCVPTLRKNFFEIRRFRNDTMHAHNMSATDFRKAEEMLRSANREIESEITSVIGRTEKQNQTEEDRQFNSGLAAAINALLSRRQSEQYANIGQDFSERIAAAGSHNKSLWAAVEASLQPHLQYAPGVIIPKGE